MFGRFMVIVALSGGIAGAAAAAAPDASARFGAREAVANATLSPDGMNIAWVAPDAARGSIVYTHSVADKAGKPVAALISNGNPERIQRCDWVSNKRLVCSIFAVIKDVDILPLTRQVAVDADGGNVKLLARATTAQTRGRILNDGGVIDWLPDTGNAALIARTFLPDDAVGSHIGSAREGLGVDRVDTLTLASTTIEPPRKNADGYLSDGRGTVRIMSTRDATTYGGYDSGVIAFLYRKVGDRNWQPLTSWSVADQSGFYPLAVDADRNIAYASHRVDGRRTIYALALDGSGKRELVFGRPDVDVDDIVQVGRRGRVVGVSFATDVTQIVYFDPALAALQQSLSKAIPDQPLVSIVDASLDEQRLLIWAGSDDDPGVYYLYDRKTHTLDILTDVRPQMQGERLAKVTPVSFPAADGTMIPAYLTLPPGMTMATAKGLKAIVLPHGGPAARDYWGFDWLSHFFAGQGYAVLRPNFRGSSGYGDIWFKDNGFKSWKVAIGDILDGGRWLKQQGIAAPDKLAIVGWSYGGYAALQAAATDPGLFKAVVAIAPVTDLAQLKEDSRYWSDFNLVSAMIGSGDHVREGSPAQNADRIKVPVLMFHGTLDRNVAIEQSTLMDARLKAAGVPHELVTYPRLDHYLEDSAVRADMLGKIDGFLAAAGLK